MVIMKKLQTVDAYIKAAPKVAKLKLTRMRSIIKTIAPKAVEGISYGMPYYNHKGRLVYFAAFKNHVSLFPAGSWVIKKFAKALKPYTTSKGTIQFPLDRPLPVHLIQRIVRARVKENESRKK